MHPPLSGPNEPKEHAALTVPVHPPGQEIAPVEEPWAVAGRVTAPQIPVETFVFGQLFGTQLSIGTPNAPNAHGALTVPVHPAGHEAGALVEPCVVAGSGAGPHDAVFTFPAGQLAGTQPSTNERKVKLLHVALTVPVHPGGHAFVLIFPWVVPGIVADPHKAVALDDVGQSRKQSSLTATKLALEHLAS